jgi:hypothetical protein
MLVLQLGQARGARYTMSGGGRAVAAASRASCRACGRGSVAAQARTLGWQRCLCVSAPLMLHYSCGARAVARWSDCVYSRVVNVMRLMVPRAAVGWPSHVRCGAHRLVARRGAERQRRVV